MLGAPHELVCIDILLESQTQQLTVLISKFAYIQLINLAKLEVWTREPPADYSCIIPSRSLLHISVLNRIEMKVQPPGIELWTSGLASQHYTIELKRLVNITKMSQEIGQA